MLADSAVSPSRPALNARLSDVESQASHLANNILSIYERLYGPLAVDPLPPPAPVSGGQIGEAHGQINTINTILNQMAAVVSEFQMKVST